MCSNLFKCKSWCSLKQERSHWEEAKRTVCCLFLPLRILMTPHLLKHNADD